MFPLRESISRQVDRKSGVPEKEKGVWGSQSRERGLKAEMKESESESEVAQSCPTLCDPWTVAHQAPPSVGFSRQEYWNGLPLPSPGDLPNPGIEPRSPTFQADALTSDKGLEFSRRRKGQTSFFSIFLSLSHIKCFFL